MRLVSLVLALLLSSSIQARTTGDSGWLLRLGDHGPAQRVPHAAFHLQQGESLHPAASGDATALYETLVRLRGDGRYRFAVEAEGGEAWLEVRNEEGARLGACHGAGGFAATSFLDLDAGRVRLIVRFDRRAKKEAKLRVLWMRDYTAGGGFPWEPLASRATSLPAETKPAAASGRLAFTGRLLLEERGCTNCHAMPAGGEHAVGKRPGPRLDGPGGGVGARADVDWLSAWILDPLQRRGSGMPQVLGGAADADQEARALAHYVASLGSGEDDGTGWAPASEEQVLARGRSLYHGVGCVACHGALDSPATVFEDDYSSDDLPGSALHPLSGLEGKWRTSALSAFLRDPLAIRPDGRMPSLGLSESEADSIANYVVARLGAGEGKDIYANLRDEGARLFGERGCQSCHALDGTFAQATAPRLDELDLAKGCFDATSTAPQHGLTPEEREAIEAALAELSGELTPAPLDAAQRRIEALGCLQCHVQDGVGGPPDELNDFFWCSDERVDLGDEGRLPPDLSGVGFKLQTPWLADVLSSGARARPYMDTRMPHFGAAADGLAELLARAEGVRPHQDVGAPVPSDDDVLTGRELLAPDRLNCMTCHVYADYPASGSPGPAITQFGERLRYEWFRSYMQNPQRYKPGSRMPDFGTGGVSSLPSVLDGDMARQSDAMWAYFGLGEFMPAPEGVEVGRGHALPVEDRPIVHRGFLKDVGSRGIAVGLPVGVHFAFDAATCRLVHAWKGSFLDASGSWAGRGGNELGGSGPIVWSAPDGPTFHLVDGPEDQKPSFNGYRVDSDGWPTFRWELGPVTIDERFSARVAPELVIERTFTFDGLGERVLRVTHDPSMTASRLEGGAKRLGKGGFIAITSEPKRGARPTLTLEVKP